jgi:hypothetical protein
MSLSTTFKVKSAADNASYKRSKTPLILPAIVQEEENPEQVA